MYIGPESLTYTGLRPQNLGIEVPALLPNLRCTGVGAKNRWPEHDVLTVWAVIVNDGSQPSGEFDVLVELKYSGAAEIQKQTKRWPSLPGKASGFAVLEILLIAGVLFHMLNGLRITLADFFGWSRSHKLMFIVAIVLFVILMIIVIIM